MKKIILKYRWLTKLVLWIHKSFVLDKTIKIKKNVFYSFSTEFKGYNTLNEGVDITNCYIGLGTYVAQKSELKNTKIGNFTSIGPYVKTIFGNHPTSIFVSTHPSFFSTRNQSGLSFVHSNLYNEFAEPLEDDNRYTISIGNDVWIGANVIILDGVRIGDGAIVAAGAIVNKDVEPFSIVGGIPAKKIKMRFEENEILALLKIKWWEKDIHWLSENASLFKNIKEFIKSVCHQDI